VIEIQGLERIYRTTTEGWKTVPMWSIATRKDRKGYAEAELLSVYREFGVICKSDRDDNHNVESEDLSSYKFVKRGDLVLNKMKTWQGSLGVSKFEGIVSPAYFVCELSTDVHGPFIHYLLRSKPYIAMYGAASKGIRVGQWDLPYEEFRDLPVLLPPIEEQRRIADYLDEQKIQMDKILSAREKQMDSLSLLLRSQIDHDLRDTAAEIDQMRLSLLLYKITTGTTPDSTLNDPDGLPWYSPASISAL
jgi:type I restriction enzyme S subunit